MPSALFKTKGRSIIMRIFNQSQSGIVFRATWLEVLDPPTFNPVNRYRVKFGFMNGAFTEEIQTGNDRLFTLTYDENHVNGYVCVTAIDDAGQESGVKCKSFDIPDAFSRREITILSHLRTRKRLSY